MRVRQSFEAHLDELHDNLFRIGTMVEAALATALEALRNEDQGMAEQTISNDEAINEAVYRVHQQALQLIATQQPMAGDLRTISVVINLLPELERMGDHAASIAKLQLRISQEPSYVPLQGLPEHYIAALFQMADRTLEIVHYGLEALRTRDRSFAERVVAMDDQIDHLYGQLFRDTITLARTQPEIADEVVHLLTLAHSLERIGDRVTNVAEQIVFLLTGQVIELNY